MSSKADELVMNGGQKSLEVAVITLQRELGRTIRKSQASAHHTLKADKE